MNATLTQLFPKLPPELRNEVYDHLSQPTPNTLSSFTGLPLGLKTFSCRHTTLQLIPVHFGSKGLLAMKDMVEGPEYLCWLLSHGITLRIGIHFRGRVNTFVQADWDKKVEQHLTKLAKQHEWIRKVAKYEIHILWGPTDGGLKSKRARRTAGGIARDMLKTVTVLMEQDVKLRKADVHVVLRIEHEAAIDIGLTYFNGGKFGFADFFAGLQDVRKLTMEVRKIREKKAAKREMIGQFVVLNVPKMADKELIAMGWGGVVSWLAEQECEAIKKYITHGRVVETAQPPKQPEGTEDQMVPLFTAMCLKE